ncbi:hypothetical protein diail_7956 [Diaporthe ilicicola]|nr:hypothetical protein diail_7956 [Diaporthe ilicicola]
MKHSVSTIAVLVCAFKISASAAPIEQNIPAQEEVSPEEVVYLATRDDDVTSLARIDFENYAGYGAEYGATPKTSNSSPPRTPRVPESSENAEGAFEASQYEHRDVEPRHHVPRVCRPVPMAPAPVVASAPVVL